MGSCCKVSGNTGSGMRVPLALNETISVPGVLAGSEFTRVPLFGSKKVTWPLSSIVSPDPARKLCCERGCTTRERLACQVNNLFVGCRWQNLPEFLGISFLNAPMIVFPHGRYVRMPGLQYKRIYVFMNREPGTAHKIKNKTRPHCH